MGIKKLALLLYRMWNIEVYYVSPFGHPLLFELEYRSHGIARVGLIGGLVEATSFSNERVRGPDIRVRSLQTTLPTGTPPRQTSSSASGVSISLQSSQ